MGDYSHQKSKKKIKGAENKLCGITVLNQLFFFASFANLRIFSLMPSTDPGPSFVESSDIFWIATLNSEVTRGPFSSVESCSLGAFEGGSSLLQGAA